MTWILSKLGGALWPLLTAVVVALSLYCAVQTVRLQHAKAATAEVQKAWQLDRARSTEAALLAQTQYRALESQMQAIKEQAQHDYDAAQTRNAAALAVARAGADKLRHDLAAYAAGSGSPADTTAAAASDRAAKLGELLAAALQLDAQHAADAEANADAVRTLLAAWPRELTQ